MWELHEKYLQILITFPNEQVLNIFTNFILSTPTIFLILFPQFLREMSTGTCASDT